MTYQDLKERFYKAYSVAPRETDSLFAQMLHSKSVTEDELSSMIEKLDNLTNKDFYQLVKDRHLEIKQIAALIGDESKKTILRDDKDLLHALENFAVIYGSFKFFAERPEFNNERFLKKLGGDEFDKWKKAPLAHILVVSGKHPSSGENGFWRYKFRCSFLECIYDEYILYQRYGVSLKYRIYYDEGGMSFFYQPFDETKAP